MRAVKVIGLMSGTSLDGVDAAMIETDGTDIGAIGPTAFVPYSEVEQAVLRRALGKWRSDDQNILKAAANIIHDRHIQAVRMLPKADLIGFHGQTVAHDPANFRTHQLGDGKLLARRTGTKTVWDFRSEDMRQGGQGAPLVPFYLFALAKRSKIAGSHAFLNIGGVANLTCADPAFSKPECYGALLAFDTGPGNAILNDFVRSRTGQSFDKDGILAASGVVNHAALTRWKLHPYFSVKPPKSVDRNDFHVILADTTVLSTHDGAASLTAFSAECVGLAVQQFANNVEKIFVSGGGAHNSVMMKMIDECLDIRVEPASALGIDGDTLEAQAFAFLAVRVLHGLPITSPGTTGCRVPVIGGQISDPRGEN